MLHYIHEFECKICTRKLLDQHRFKSVSLRSGCHNTATGQGGYAYGKDDIVSNKTASGGCAGVHDRREQLL
jgi:hypothetical protein